MKCAYSAGILDKFLDDHIQFDYCIGVSAGAANTLSYLAGQRGRNLRFYTEHLSDPRYLSVHSLIRTGSLFGLQYIYGTLTNSDGKDPIDYDAIMKIQQNFICLPRMPSPEQPLTFPNTILCATITAHSWQPAPCRDSVVRFRLITITTMMAALRILFRCSTL